MTRRGILTRLQVAPFELAIAVLLVVSGVRYLIDEAALEASNIGQSLPFPEAWAAGYALAGIFIGVGLLLPLARMEATGLSLMAAMVAINAVVAAYTGWSVVGAGGTIVSLAFYSGLVIAALARLRVLLRGSLVVYSWGENAKIVVGTAPPMSDADGH